MHEFKNNGTGLPFITYPFCNEYIFPVSSALCYKEIPQWSSQTVLISFQAPAPYDGTSPNGNPRDNKSPGSHGLWLQWWVLACIGLITHRWFSLFLKVVLAWKREKTKLARIVGRNEPSCIPIVHHAPTFVYFNDTFRELRWWYTGRFATTIFSPTQRCSIVATLFQHCNAVLRRKSSLQIVSCNITLKPLTRSRN